LDRRTWDSCLRLYRSERLLWVWITTTRTTVFGRVPPSSFPYRPSLWFRRFCTLPQAVPANTTADCSIPPPGRLRYGLRGVTCTTERSSAFSSVCAGGAVGGFPHSTADSVISTPTTYHGLNSHRLPTTTWFQPDFAYHTTLPTDALAKTLSTCNTGQQFQDKRTLFRWRGRLVTGGTTFPHHFLPARLCPTPPPTRLNVNKLFIAYIPTAAEDWTVFAFLLRFGKPNMDTSERCDSTRIDTGRLNSGGYGCQHATSGRVSDNTLMVYRTAGTVCSNSERDHHRWADVCCTYTDDVLLAPWTFPSPHHLPLACFRINDAPGWRTYALFATTAPAVPGYNTVGLPTCKRTAGDAA